MKLIVEIWKKEFSFQSLSLAHEQPSDFYSCQWQKSRDVSVGYLLYRIAVALIFFVTLILSIVDINNVDDPNINRAKWLIYLTHWGYAVCTLQAIIACYIVMRMYRKVRKRNAEFIATDVHISPGLYATYWVLYTIATDAAFAITCIYWTLIFNPEQHPLNTMNIFVHGINSVLMLTDLFVVAHPVRLLHCYWPFLFAVIYVVFNLVYYLAGGTDKNGLHYIYPILDWKKPGKSATITFLALIFLVFLHLLTYCMFLLRRRIYAKYKIRKEINTYSVENKNQQIYCEHTEYL